MSMLKPFSMGASRSTSTKLSFGASRFPRSSGGGGAGTTGAGCMASLKQQSMIPKARVVRKNPPEVATK